MLNLVVYLLLFLAPSIYFLIQNLSLGEDGGLLLAPIISITLFGIIILLSSPLLFFKNKKLFILAIIFSSSCWYLQFLMLDLLPSYSVTIQLVIITSLSLCLVVIATQINISKFVLIFLCLNFVAVLIPKTDYLYKLLSRNFLTNESNGIINATPKIRGTNIYYVVADGLTSLKILNEKYKIPTIEFEKDLKNNKFSVFSDSKSSYNITHLTLGSIFSLGYPVTEDSPKYKDRFDFFPSMLSIPYSVPLLVKLDSLDYKFVHIGNQWAGCSTNRLVRCFTDHRGTPLKLYISMLSEKYSIQTFLDKTLFYSGIVYLLKENKPQYNSYGKKMLIDPNQNDGIGTIINAIKSKRIQSSGRSFYFVHHLNPHPPALRQDCSVSDDKDYQKWTTLGYTESSICALNKISEFIKVISEADPSAIVVIQGDHGPGMGYPWDKDFINISEYELEGRFSIFNAIKLPESCILPPKRGLGNVETIQLVIDCIAGSKTANETSKSYVGFYEGNKNFGKVFEVTPKKLSR